MDAGRLDALARMVHGTVTRRRGCAALVGAIAAGMADDLAGFPETEAKDRKNRHKKARRKRCLRDGHRCGNYRGRERGKCHRCCSGFSRPKTGPHRRCACRPDGTGCSKDAQCCSRVCQDGACAGETPLCIPAGEACPSGGLDCCSGLTCLVGTCQEPPGCGALDEACCAGSTCDSGLLCDGATCVACGAVTEPCCAGDACDADLVCDTNTCVPCGASGEACCDPDVCDSGLICDGTTCAACGNSGELCCVGDICTGANLLCNGTTCEPCGGSGEQCCIGGTCSSANLLCNGTSCEPCGGDGEPCCSGSCDSNFTCRSDDVCVADRCYTPLVTVGCTFTTSWSCDESTDLSALDLSGCDLAGLECVDCALSAGPSGPATTFDNANLTGALFQTFAGRLTSFVGADLTNATFDSYFGGFANFTSATLGGTSFINGGNYQDADFTGTNVGTVAWSGSVTCPSGASLGSTPTGTCCSKWAPGKAPATGCP